jgi:hypothetical protein
LGCTQATYQPVQDSIELRVADPCASARVDGAPAALVQRSLESEDRPRMVGTVRVPFSAREIVIE